jgi:DNA-binding transcriptional MerR regulator
MLKKGRKYYRIGEVSQIIGVEPHVLRFWEKEFRQIQPRRISGRRLYRQQDLATIKRIKELLYKEGYTIAGARKRLEQDRAPVQAEARHGAGSALSDGPLHREKKGEDARLPHELKHELMEIRDILKRG